MSATNPGPGRPPGKAQKTLDLMRRVKRMTDLGMSRAAIAECEDIAEGYVRLLLRMQAAPSQQQTAEAPVPAARPKPRKMSEGALLSRAFAAIRNVRAFKGLLDAETREFWIEALIEIRALADDGAELTFGQPGDVYHSQAEFLSVFKDITPVQLKKLFHHAMLVDLNGSGIAVPSRWGFRDTLDGSARRAEQAIEKLSEAQDYPFDPDTDDTTIEKTIPISVPPDDTTIEKTIPISVPEVARAPSPSLTSYPSYQPTEITKESKEVSEGEGARAGVPPGDTTIPISVPPGDTTIPISVPPGDTTIPELLCQSSRGRSDPPPRQTRLPEDWQPTPEAVAAIVKAGRDPAPIVAKFRANQKAKGKVMADWNAAFEVWWLDEPKFEGAVDRQMPLTRSLPGGKPEKGAFLNREVELMARRRAGSAEPNGADQEGGPIIEGRVADG